MLYYQFVLLIQKQNPTYSLIERILTVLIANKINIDKVQFIEPHGEIINIETLEDFKKKYNELYTITTPNRGDINMHHLLKDQINKKYQISLSFYPQGYRFYINTGELNENDIKYGVIEILYDIKVLSGLWKHLSNNYQPNEKEYSFLTEIYSLWISLYETLHPVFCYLNKDQFDYHELDKYIINYQLPTLFNVNIFSRDFVEKINRNKLLNLENIFWNKMNYNSITFPNEISKKMDLPFVKELDDGGILISTSYNPFRYPNHYSREYNEIIIANEYLGFIKKDYP